MGAGIRRSLFLIVVLIMVFAVTGCGSDDAKEDAGLDDLLQDADKRIKEGVEVTPEMKRLVDHFKKAGLKIGEYHPKLYEMAGASAGFGLEVEGDDIEIYYFDPAKTDEETINRLKESHKPEGPSVLNGDYQLFIIMHPEQEKIIEVFMSFK